MSFWGIVLENTLLFRKQKLLGIIDQESLEDMVLFLSATLRISFDV